MIKKALGKHVIIRIDGMDLLGFVLGMDNNYIELVERDNDTTIIKIQDISFIKIISSKAEVPKQEIEVKQKTQSPPLKTQVEDEIPKPQKKANPQQLAAVVSKKRDNDFSVVDHGLNGGGYQTPNFSRQTERK